MKLVGLVLAGGQSSRMKTDKALLPLEGKSLLDRAILLLEDCGCDQVFVSGERQGYQSIPDQLPDAGPLGGIYSFSRYYLENFSDSKAFAVIIPVDMPCLTQELIKSLIESYSMKNDEVAMHFSEQVFPLIVRLEAKLVDAIDKLVEPASDKYHFSVRNLLSSLEATSKPLESDFQWQLTNINTPEDWELVKSHFS